MSETVDVRTYMTERALNRFLSLIDDSGGEDACWPYRGWHDKDGYGVVKHRGKMLRAHRIVYMLARGHTENLVLHRCDNQECCNPRHLFDGSHADNMRDKAEKGRQTKGETNGNSRLTAETVLEILSSVGPVRVVAPRFGVSSTTIQDIRTGRTWKHLGKGSDANGRA